MKKYIAILSAVLLAIALAGCEKIEDEPVSATVPSESITQVETISETEATVPETLADLPKVETEAAVEAGGDVEEQTEVVGVEKISLSIYEVTLQVGQSKMPLVTMLPENASDKSEIWATSDESVAIVDGQGNITAVASGECVVRVVSAQNTAVEAEVAVTVTEASEAEDVKLTYIDGILIANKTYALPSDYAPGVDPEAEVAFEKMAAEAYGEGLTLYISSGYRSYDYQSGLYQRYVDRSGKAEVDRYSARPGHSEHQTGLAFDLNTISDEFRDTDEGRWVAENCHKYGFIVRYPEDKEAVTGYIYEPWHIRYLGVETATAVYESGLCLEEYLGITSEYAE